MHRSRHNAIRRVLREHPDGLTVKQLEAYTGFDTGSLRQALKIMPDCYIDRWLMCKNQWGAVWCAVVVPENCPKPDEVSEVL